MTYANEGNAVTLRAQILNAREEAVLQLPDEYQPVLNLRNVEKIRTLRRVVSRVKEALTAHRLLIGSKFE
jgi:hypothetical protein